MFDDVKRNHLARRLQRTIGLPDNPLVRLLVAQIAKANYPTGSEEPKILAPVIDQPEISRLTTAFVDRGVGTLGTLYRSIWGMSPRAYVAQQDQHLDDESH
ncbi:MAG: hypothetical protein ACLPVY_22720 [Acidimicrobiia bacterium]